MPLTTGQPLESRRAALGEALTGLICLALATYVGLVFVHRPALNALDRFGFRELAPSGNSHSELLKILLNAGSKEVDIAAVAIAVMLTVLRDWRRAIACIAGTALAVVITQSIAKPLVAGNVSGFGGHSYPSGTVTAVAAYATALVLAVPIKLRPYAAAVALAAICAVSGAVIAARWHFATDALGGTFVGVGAVLVFDGGIHLVRPRHYEMLATTPSS
jgi:membrane-associated phospholipid phosphatase